MGHVGWMLSSPSGVRLSCPKGGAAVSLGCDSDPAGVCKAVWPAEEACFMYAAGRLDSRVLRETACGSPAEAAARPG